MIAGAYPIVPNVDGREAGARGQGREVASRWVAPLINCTGSWTCGGFSGFRKGKGEGGGDLGDD